MTLEALIFDVDGTLAETEEAHRRAFNQAFAEAGLDWNWDVPEYGRLLKVAGGKERIRSYVEARGIELSDLDATVRRLHARKTELYGEAAGGGALPLRSGIVRLFEDARGSGLRLAIATTTSRANVDNLFEGTLGAGSLSRFEVIETAETSRKKKPAPDVYLAALRGLGLAPEACLAIEDTENGVRSARSAGIPVLVTESTYSRGQPFEGAAAVVSELGDPGVPATRIRGPALEDEHISLGFLRSLHAVAVSEARAP